MTRTAIARAPGYFTTVKINEKTFENVNYRDIFPKLSVRGILTGWSDAIDEEAIKNSLRNLFAINLGQVPGKPWLGNPLNIYLFDNISYFEEKAIKAAFINTIDKFEPRVNIIDVKIEIEPEYNSVNIFIVYTLNIGDINKVRNYRFSLNYNTMTNISLRENT